MAFRRRAPVYFASSIVFVALLHFLHVPTKLDTKFRGTKISPNLDPSTTEFTRKIWQTSKDNAENLQEAWKLNVERWRSQNSGWDYEMLTDEQCVAYVQQRFEKEPEIIKVYTGLKDNILRADLFRYLVLFADGGVYSDMDTEALKPIARWIPEQYANQANAVLGVEYDTYGQGRGMALLDLQLANWTLMSKKGHGLMRLVVQRAMEALREIARSQNVPLSGIKATFNDVLASTGPARMTLSVWEYLSAVTGEEISWLNATGLAEPKLIADVLLLPVTSFGNGQMHSFSKPPTDEQALVHHQFSGSWKVGEHAYAKMKDEEKHEPEIRAAPKQND